MPALFSWSLTLPGNAYWLIDLYTLDWGRRHIDAFLDAAQARALPLHFKPVYDYEYRPCMLTLSMTTWGTYPQH